MNGKREHDRNVYTCHTYQVIMNLLVNANIKNMPAALGYGESCMFQGHFMYTHKHEVETTELNT